MVIERGTAQHRRRASSCDERTDGRADPSCSPTGAPRELAGLGARSRGPPRWAPIPRRLWHLTWALAKTEFKLAFFGSALGYLWQLMRPLLLFGVIYLVVSRSKLALRQQGPVLRDVAAARHRAVQLLRESTSGGVSCLVDRENLVRKIEFPRLAVPLSIVLTALLNLVAQPDPGGDLPARRRRLAAVELARAAAAGARAGAVLRRARDDPVGVLRALPRRAPDLGSGAADDLLRVGDLHPDPHARDDHRARAGASTSVTC